MEGGRHAGAPTKRRALDRLKDDEGIAETEARFRDANERIHEAAVRAAIDSAVPFICECAAPRCLEVLRVPLDEYERIRSNPRRFLNVPGHERAAGSAARVVATHDGWIIVEKAGDAGRDAEERSGGGVGASEGER